MADIAVVFDSTPNLAVYNGTRPDYDLAYPRLLEVGQINSALRIDSGETPSLSVTVNNNDGFLNTAIPLLVDAAVYLDSVEIWSGVVVRVRGGSVMEIGMEA